MHGPRDLTRSSRLKHDISSFIIKNLGYLHLFEHLFEQLTEHPPEQLTEHPVLRAICGEDPCISTSFPAKIVTRSVVIH